MVRIHIIHTLSHPHMHLQVFCRMIDFLSSKPGTDGNFLSSEFPNLQHSMDLITVLHVWYENKASVHKYFTKILALTIDEC